MFGINNQLPGIISRETLFRRVLPVIGLITFTLLLLSPYLPILIQFRMFQKPILKTYPLLYGILFAFFAFPVAWVLAYTPRWFSAHRLTALMVIFVYQFNPTRLHLTLPFLLIFFVYATVSNGGRLRIHWSPSHWALCVVFFCWMMADYTFTKYLGYSAIYQGLLFGTRLLNSIFFLSFFHDKDDMKFLFRAFLFLTFATTLVGSLQFLGYELTGTTKTFSNLSSKWAYIGGRQFIRPTGMSNHPSVYGYVCMTISITCMYILLARHRYTTTHPALLFLMWAYFGIHTFISFSRSIWIGWAAAMIILTVVLLRRNLLRILTIGSILLAVIIISGLAQLVVEFVVDINKTSLAFRIDQMHYAFEEFFKRPFSGLGTKQYANAPGNLEKLHVHNTLLMVLTEGGLATGIAYITFLGVALYRGFSRFYRCSEHYSRFYLGLFSILLLSSVVENMGQQAFYNSLPFIFVALIEAMIYIGEHGGDISMEKKSA